MHPDEASFRDELEWRRLPPWHAPFHWWGPSWNRAQPRRLDELVEDGVLDHGTAATLVRAVHGGESIIVAAEPSRVGKSTLAAALVAELPEETEHIYIRGSFETFDFAGERDASRRALLVNEFSPHLPIYLWGGAARRVLQLAGESAQVMGTIHASAPEEVIYQLSRQPIGATPAEIAALGMVVLLGPPSPSTGDRWTVSRVVRLRATSHGVRVTGMDSEPLVPCAPKPPSRSGRE